ncbi:MAG: serine hydrolase [Acidobacteria bacterium]|nr:serine hydrolase [Acidobacteriota bacterium]
MKRPFSLLCLIAAASVTVPTVFAQTDSLRVGTAMPGTLAEGDAALYTVETSGDYFLFGEVDQISVDVVVRILGPDGAEVASFDGPARGPERFVRQLDGAGIYQIEVTPFEEESGDYEIELFRLEPVETRPDGLTDQLMSPYSTPDSPGAAVQVWRDGETVYSRAYGSANLAHGLDFATDTRTNIGSTSKQFTAFAIMLQADRGLLSLDDDIRTHIPELPEFDETITVRHLITHTSGLREFLNLLMMSGRRLDHGDWIGRDELIGIVQRQPKLQNAPGAEFNYNNTAFGLAAEIVERTSGQDFHEFMQDSVFGPLDMSGTMVRPSPEHIVPNSSEGYTPGSDGYRQIGDLGGAVGAGGMYSTVEDLQTWVQNYAQPHVGSADIFEEMMTPYVLTNGEETGYGYGLFVDEQRGLRRVHHGGADVAHRSMLVYYPEINAGVTVQSNHASFNAGVAFELAAAFFDDAMDPEEEEAESDFDPTSYAPENFDEFVGRYSLDPAPDFILTFTRDEGVFYTQATGQQQLEIVPTSATTFELVGVDASIEFLRNDDDEVDGLTLFQNGENHATRLDDEGSAPWEPTTEDLADFEGRFFSEELETFYTIVLQEESLVMQHRRLDDANLSPGEEDRFSGGGLSYTFERDRNGQVIGFYIANGRTRDVRFERVR